MLPASESSGAGDNDVVLHPFGVRSLTKALPPPDEGASPSGWKPFPQRKRSSPSATPYPEDAVWTGRPRVSTVLTSS